MPSSRLQNAATTGQVCLCRNVIAVHELEGLDVDDLAHLLHRYLRLDDEMLQAASLPQPGGDVEQPVSLCANMTSSIKPEIRSVSLRSQKRTKPRP